MTDYRSRVVDSELAAKMSAMGAVLIDGPKAVGKTFTAEQVAGTIMRMDVDRAARAALEIDPDQLFRATPPIVFDEWQETPDLWNLVRRAVDDHKGKGLYILTGSSRPRDQARVHSGAGRIGRLRMRPMSLVESGHSSGEVSLKALLSGEEPSGTPLPLTITDLLERIVIGGWPDLLEADEYDSRIWLRDYSRNIAEIDVPGLGPRRNPGNITRLLTALGRATGTPQNLSALARDVGGARGPIASETLTNYMEALERLMLIEPLPAWQPHMRSKTRLRTSPIQHFVDPSLGISTLGVDSNALARDLEAAGLHFESMVLRDLRIYSQSLGAQLYSWRDSQTGAEVDVILEYPNSSWAGIEIKMGESAVDSAAESLLRCAQKIDSDKHGDPIALIVITGGRYSYRRPDGVCVVPITALGP
ncbi:MAG: DUF4143 domain-containing protein [Actinomycetaceae bacterium]|nr:DUF4143 domain-containing protein [Actinomycetaceae bacterium]